MSLAKITVLQCRRLHYLVAQSLNKFKNVQPGAPFLYFAYRITKSAPDSTHSKLRLEPTHVSPVNVRFLD